MSDVVDALLHPAPQPELPDDTSLVERYERMAVSFQRRPADRALRVLDIVIASSALVVLSPVLGVVTVGVLATSGRPVLYRGPRVGVGGRVFLMRKFRTLRPDAETRLGSLYGEELTRATAAEVTPVGRALRLLHIDEAPQLINVLRGEMSIVGPRPIRPAFLQELSTDVPAYWQRLVVPPGITGLAQVRLTRELAWPEKLSHDMEYVADRSVALYLHVLALTVARIARRAVGQGEAL